MEPYLSVIIIAHDRKQFLKSAVESVVSQVTDLNQVEIIVIKNYKDQEIDLYLEGLGVTTLYSESQPLGSKVAAALSQARGKVVSFLEDDDLYSSTKLRIIQDCFLGDETLVYLHNAFNTIDAESRNVNQTPFFMRQPDKSGMLEFESSIRESMRTVYKYGLHFNLSSITMKKNAISREILDGLDIIDFVLFYMAVISKGKIQFLSDKLTSYRVHISDSKTFEKNINDFATLKIGFHEKISRSLSILAKIVRGTQMEKYVLCDLAEQGLVQKILGMRSPRETIWENIHTCLKGLKLHSGRKKCYVFGLSLLGILSLLSSRFPRLLVYSSSRLL